MALFGFGSNIMGQLAHSEEYIFVDKPIEIEFFRDRRIRKMACGKMHVLVLCENGELYSWGVNDDYALGRDGVDEEGIKKVETNTRDEIVDICAGASYSAFLTKKGHVYLCGTFKSTNGVFGFSLNSKFGIGFRQVSNLKGITSIDAGMNHILMLSKTGDIWSMGANESYQLGRKHRIRREKYVLIPMQISSIRNKEENYRFIRVAAGAYHSLGMNDGGEVFSWGSNCNGQLGNGTLEPGDLKYKLGIQNVVDVACGYNHTLIMQKGGGIFGCGENGQKQFGICGGNKTLKKPTKIADGFERIRSGGDFIVVEKKNKLYAAGINVECECGLENRIEEVSKLTEIQFDFGRIIDYQCGGNYTLIYTE
ncbi:RCC1 [Enterospora canceri]|uniref:RCC1 n=1 Tax=Enterospora canceri TaxID=1081671 RepID=A0A1Y1S709_9MICR|nr:RCC1 [Enterospora canceri]